MVSFLVSKGAQVDVQDKMGRTPAMLATELGNDAILNLLIKNNADLTLRDNEGKGDQCHTHTKVLGLGMFPFLHFAFKFPKREPKHLSSDVARLLIEIFPF